jgi:hypothetical protein
MAKTKRTNNDLQNSTQQTEDRATRTPLTTECVPEVYAGPAPHLTPVVLLL